MTLQQALLKVLSGNIIAQLLVGMFGLYLINLMPVDAYADYTLYQSLTFLAIGLVVNPFNRILIVSAEKELFEWLLPLQFFLMAPLLLYAYFYLGSDILLWLLFSLASLALLIFEYYKGVSQKVLDFNFYRRMVSGRAFIFVLVGFSLTSLFSYESHTYIYLIIFSSFGAYALSLMILFYYKPLDLLLSRAPTVLEVRYLLCRYGFLLGYFLLSAAFAQLDFIFLRFLSSSIELATYGASFQYYLLLMMVMNSLKQVLLPVLVKNKSISFFEMSRDLLPIYFLFSVLVIILIATFGIWAGPVEMGKYEGTELVFGILAISLILSMLCSPASEFLQIADKYRAMFITLLVSCVCNVILNYYLVDLYGAAGVAVATLISFLILNFSFVIMSYRLNVNKANI